MNRDLVPDFHAVAAEHIAIHERLINWQRYVSSGGRTGPIAPMFRGYRPYLWPRESSGVVVDTLDGHEMEKAVGRLPPKHRDAIRWCYVFSYIRAPKVCRLLGVSSEGLAGLIHDGRVMLKNRA